MGTKQSSLAKSASTENEEIQELEIKLAGEGGRSVNQTQNIIEVSSEEFSIETDSDTDHESDESDDEEDEEFLERLRILEDAKKLKELAVAFLHPENPVKVDPTACARCYFDRPSAPEQEDTEEAEYHRQVLEDAAALKKLAVDFAHPEVGVVTSDPSATARCYFDRSSAPEQEDAEEAEYRHQVLEDAAALKKLAIDYAHPELGVVTSDPTACARCYFDRVSTPEDESEYRRQVLEDAAALKKLAVDYAHPELGVVSSDPTVTARCYFNRPSAPEQEDGEEAEYRRQVLADAAALKKLAIDYAHPELGVVTSDPSATARCYFGRASAPDQEDAEEAEYHRQVLEDTAALKKLAVDYAHPELRVVTSDPSATARCYFDRASAPEQESSEVSEYRDQILADASSLKKLATDYAHPEVGVVTSDPSATARCYFDRPSAPEQESLEVAEYRDQVLADALELKKLAVDYAHPELGVITSDPSATSRCYFSRPSAPQHESLEEDEYRRQVLADAAALKKLAVDYAHPELGVVTSDPSATARCYFSRASAPEQESMEEVDYRLQVLEDASSLKKLATAYAHPEAGVVSSDSAATARCYFDRPSAPQLESLEEAEYHRQVLEDASALKKLAIDYAHPELGVVTSDPTATARCYFDRPSAPQEIEKEATVSVPTQSVSIATTKTIEMNPATESKSVTVKTLDSTKKDSDIGRSLSSVQLFGLGGEGDSSF